MSWRDADAYAAWLSRKTGETYRLPTDEEWAYAAGSRYQDDGLPVDDNDPSKRWLARYEREADLKSREIDGKPRPFGAFGANENGLLDVAGNVWEWTNTCFVRTALDDAGRHSNTTANCGVRVVEGQHRAYVTDFIRDARAGGCAAGVPPSNLGFRLVRETGLIGRTPVSMRGWRSTEKNSTNGEYPRPRAARHRARPHESVSTKTGVRPRGHQLAENRVNLPRRKSKTNAISIT